MHRFAGSPIPSGDPIGYEIVDGDRALAAVETINRGRVWIAHEVSEEERARIASVATALLLADE